MNIYLSGAEFIVQMNIAYKILKLGADGWLV
jgi:hypothetical protein